MTKTSKKLLLVILLTVLSVFMLNAKAFAVSNAEQAVAELKNKNNFKDRTVFVGQRMEVFSNNNYSILHYIRPTIKSSNPSVVDFEKDSITNLVAKAEGYATITVTYVNTYSVNVTDDTQVDETGAPITRIETKNETITQSYKITVKKADNAKLQSKTNDVVAIESNYLEKKTKVLLANGELWNINDNTCKLEKKDTGNVKKYTYGDVYFREGKNSKWPMVYHTLKNNKKLTTKTDLGTFKATDVVDVNACGYLNSKGKYYALVIKADKVSYKQKAKKVEALLGDYLLKKSDGLYTIANEKIADGKIKDAMGYPDAGLFLNNKNVLYRYTFDPKAKKYKIEKVEKNVKAIVNEAVYKDKNGKLKTIYKGYTNFEFKKIFHTLGGQLKLKYNGNLYMGDAFLLNNVVDMINNSTDYYKIYLVKKDGSIWTIKIGDNSSLKQIRSGKDSAKGLSIPTKVKAKKKGSKKAKVTWKKVDGATKYTVYRATSKNGKYKQVGTAKGGSYTDKTVKKGKKYFYKVVANGSKKIFNSKKSEAAKVKM